MQGFGPVCQAILRLMSVMKSETIEEAVSPPYSECSSSSAPFLRPPGPQINISAWVLCMSWCADRVPGDECVTRPKHREPVGSSEMVVRPN